MEILTRRFQLGGKWGQGGEEKILQVKKELKMLLVLVTSGANCFMG